MAEQHFDLDAIARAAPRRWRSRPRRTRRRLPPPGQRIALARDQAFSFVYPHLVDGWRRAGAEILPFSPLADEPPPDRADSCWLPGGYPELHAGALAAARRFADGLRRFAQTRPVHGECGGYMVLGQSLEDARGTHPRHDRIARPFDEFRQAQTASRLSLGAASFRLRPRPRRHDRARPRISLCHAHLDRRRRRLCGSPDSARSPTWTSGGRRGRVSGTFFHAIAAD